VGVPWIAPDSRRQNNENGVPLMFTRCQEMQIYRSMKMLSSAIKNFECGNSGHFCSYDIYAVTVNDMYMESSKNEGNTTPPRNSSVLNVVILECNGSDTYRAPRNITLKYFSVLIL
jgi:hypothetical protein